MFHLIEPDLGRISGGLRYNWAVIDAANGQLLRHAIPGEWPEPSVHDIAALQDLVASLNAPILLDGLIGCSLPEPLTAQVPVVLLIHALAEDPSAQHREQRCLQAADAIIATSHFAADALGTRYGVDVVVAQPGVARRPLATGSSNGGHFISVGAVEPNKNQVFVTRVLQRLAEQHHTGWHVTFAGPLVDDAYAQQLRAACANLPQGSTTITGELPPPELAALYDQADLLVFPSRAETFGLVVREATAAGLPAFVTEATGAQEALGGGQALPLDEQAWAEALQSWLTDNQYRSRLQAAARTARDEMTYGWRAAAHKILQVLRSVSTH